MRPSLSRDSTIEYMGSKLFMCAAIGAAVVGGMFFVKGADSGSLAQGVYATLAFVMAGGFGLLATRR